MSLPKFEVKFYFILWIICFIYCFYIVYLKGTELHERGLLEKNDFINGWRILNRSKDISDSDWVIWTSFLYKLLPWIILHLISCEIMRFIYVEIVPICHVLITSLVLLFNFPIITSIVLIFQFLLFYIVATMKSKILIWMFGIIFLIIINSIPALLKYNYYVKHYDEIALSSVCLGWFLIKCIDFGLSTINHQDSKPKLFINFIGYVFYLPCFFLGPFIPYDYFMNKVYSKYRKWNAVRIGYLILDILKYLMWYTIYEIAAHYFYCHSMHYSPEILVPLGLWTLSGVGLCMAQFFFIKYVVVYGTSIVVAKVEGYPVPAHPKCVNRIYLYSDMWRNFDKGFYLFIFRCIYKPICGKSTPKLINKLFASFLCFCFVFMWHGINITVFFWCIFNFLGLTIEALWNVLKKNNNYNLIKNYISERNARRCHAFIASLLWLMAIISNFIFFGGHNLGIIYVNEIMNGSWLAITILLTIAYCMSQISIATEQLSICKSWNIKDLHIS